MKPVTRWSLVGLAVVVIAILFMLWSQRDKQQAPADRGVAQQPAAPMPSKADEPVTASVHFDFDRSVLRAGEMPKLDELAAKVKGRAFDRVDAVGHADQIARTPTTCISPSSVPKRCALIWLARVWTPGAFAQKPRGKVKA